MTEVKVFINGFEKEGTMWVSGHWGDIHISAVGKTFDEVLDGDLQKNGEEIAYSILLQDVENPVKNEERELFFLQLWKKHNLYAGGWHSTYSTERKEYILRVFLSKTDWRKQFNSSNNLVGL